ncbi:MAG: anaerobic ribonucleoside-triphosphate reductase activating protein [Candidatus Bathyarchaeia archaeon]
MRVRIGGLVEISTVDWYGYVTFMAFFAGCNFRCPFCQNAELIPPDSGEEVDLDYVKGRIKESAPLIDAVGASGGEPTLQPKPLLELFRWARGEGLRTFLDTNASRPTVVQSLIRDGLLDQISIDVKGPLSDGERLSVIIGLSKRAAIREAENIRETIRLCLSENIPTEIRTTIVPTIIDDEETIRTLARDVRGVGGCDVYTLQQFFPVQTVLDKRYAEIDPPKRDVLKRLGGVAKAEGFKRVRIKTREFGAEEM